MYTIKLNHYRFLLFNMQLSPSPPYESAIICYVLRSDKERNTNKSILINKQNPNKKIELKKLRKLEACKMEINEEIENMITERKKQKYGNRLKRMKRIYSK